MDDSTDKYFLEMALEVAKKALPIDEVPVGCVVVNSENEVICSYHNLTNTLKDPLAHAEYLCIQSLINTNMLEPNLTFYITIEPCAMCAGVLERINVRVVFGYHNDIFGSQKILNKKIGECLDYPEAIEILKEFYKTPNKNTTK